MFPIIILILLCSTTASFSQAQSPAGMDGFGLPPGDASTLSTNMYRDALIQARELGVQADYPPFTTYYQELLVRLHDLSNIPRYSVDQSFIEFSASIQDYRTGPLASYNQFANDIDWIVGFHESFYGYPNSNMDQRYRSEISQIIDYNSTLREYFEHRIDVYMESFALPTTTTIWL